VEGEVLRVRFQRGDVVVELDGAADAVREELGRLAREGLGRVAEFFGGSDDVAAGSKPPVPPPDPPRASQPLTTPARTLAFAIDAVRLPASADEFGIDVRGDGTRHNRLGSIVAALSAQGFDVQSWVDETTANAADVALLRVATEKDDLSADQRADVIITLGAPTDATPAAHAVRSSAGVTTLCGRLSSGRFVSEGQPVEGASTALALPLSFAADGPSVVRVAAPSVGFVLTADGSHLVDGHISGVGAADDVAAVIGSGLAARLSALIAADPSAPTAQLMATLFDIGASAPDGAVAAARDGVIGVSEILANPLLRTVMAPDVVPGGADEASDGQRAAAAGVSMGVGFTAIASSF
jgi:hypothetical protein